MLSDAPEQEAVMMLKRFAQVSTLTLLLALFAVPAAHASTRFDFHLGIGAPVVVPVPVARAPYGYVWQPGYYARTPFGARWVPGAWLPRTYERRGWAPERWREGRGW